MIKALFLSRKFVVVLAALLVAGALTWAKTFTPEDFKEILKWLVSVLVGGIAVEGAAEKWNAPPPTQPSDSLRPPPPPATPSEMAKQILDEMRSPGSEKG
jgi:hypothetical protein